MANIQSAAATATASWLLLLAVSRLDLTAVSMTTVVRTVESRISDLRYKYSRKLIGLVIIGRSIKTCTLGVLLALLFRHLLYHYITPQYLK